MENQSDIQAPERRPEHLSSLALAAALDDYNRWRRGGPGEQPDPVELGNILAAAANALRSQPKPVERNARNTLMFSGTAYQQAASKRCAELEREVVHWKANHATEVRRARILKERTDMPIERVAAYKQWEYDLAQVFSLTAEVKRLRELITDNAEVEGLNFSPIGGNKYLALCRDGYKKCGIAMERIEPDGRVSRVWVGTHGMILWPRTECEAGVERAEIALLKLENEKLRKQLSECSAK